ncbi:hypothetical protein, partial [Variovorax sp. Varisp62]|uniref:hypothetical protein n=1 Tax=Variovorax sp. Varisp62 TaxID=3243049 RepID=UPI0039B5DB3E
LALALGGFVASGCCVAARLAVVAVALGAFATTVVAAFSTFATLIALATFTAFAAGAGCAFSCVAFVACDSAGCQLLGFQADVAVEGLGRRVVAAFTAFAFAALATAAAALFAVARCARFT